MASYSENKPDWKPDLGDSITQKSDPGQSLYGYAEGVFIRMLKAALEDHDRWTWDQNRENRKVEILSSASDENQDYLPQIRVQVGPISSLDDSTLDNLKKWSQPLERRLYVDRAQVRIVCTCELNAESAALADHIRRIMSLAESDLGKRGILGLQNASIQPPQSARQSPDNDDVYESVLQTPFVILEREEREAGEGDPILQDIKSNQNWKAGEESQHEGTFDPEPEDETGSSDASVTKVVGDTTENEIRVRFDQKIGVNEVSGVTIKIKQTIPFAPRIEEGNSVLFQLDGGLDDNEYNTYTKRDTFNFSQIIIDIPDEITDNYDILVYYDDTKGNLKDYEGRDIGSFGPKEVTWK